MSGDATFSPDLFKFLRELKSHNDRDWFNANKPRYEKYVRGASLEFIRQAGPVLGKVSKQLVADPRPVGGSLFRIYRDTRFSKDKSPYKTHVGIHFTHRMTKGDAHAPGIYVHLEPGESAVYGGVWQPEPPMLRQIRDAIVEDPKAWQKVLKAGLAFEGDALKRPPPGYAKDHRFVEDLKRKDFIAAVPVKDVDVASARWMRTFEAACAQLEPVNGFIADAMGVPW